VLGRGSFFYGLGGFDFSYDEVNRAVVIWLIGFVFAIASAACCFLYLKTMNTSLQKKEKKKEKKSDREIGSSRNHLSTFLY